MIYGNICSAGFEKKNAFKIIKFTVEYPDHLVKARNLKSFVVKQKRSSEKIDTNLVSNAATNISIQIENNP